MAETNKPKEQPVVSRGPREVSPQEPKPKGFITVHFSYIGQDKKKKGKIFLSYVSPKIAELYRKRLSEGRPGNIIKVE